MAKFSFNNLVNSISKLISEEQVIEKRKDPQQAAHEIEIQNAILLLAAEVIRCNRNYTSGTEDFIVQFFVKQFGEREAKQRISSVSGHLDMGTEPLLKIACKELKMLTTHDSRLSILQFLFGVADADDFINPKELRCLNRIATYLGISDKDFKELKLAFISENNPYKILGIEEEATLEQVKAAYRKMVLKFHPDKRGADVSTEEANVKFLQVQRAFGIIKEQRK
jgi:DnaJ like chaperone protein